MNGDKMNYIPLESIWNLDKLKKMQDQISRVCGFYAYCVDEFGYPMTEMSGSAQETEIIRKAIGKERYEALFQRVGGKSIEDQVIEDTIYKNVKLAAVRISSMKATEITWIITAVFRELCDESPALEGLSRTVSEEKFYQELDLIRAISRSLIEAKAIAAEANLQSVKTQSVSANLSEDLKRIEALTEVVSLLGCDLPVEEVFGDALKHSGEYLNISSAQVFRMNRDGETMDILAEYLAEGLTSHFDRTKNIEKSPLLYGDKAVIVSSNTTISSSEKKLMEEAHVKARACFPILIGGSPVMYVFFAECKRPRFWSTEEIRFMNDVVQVMQSILEKRIQKNSLVSSYASLEMILDHVGGAILVQDTAMGRILFANKVLKSTFGEMIQDGSLNALFKETEGEEKREHREIFCKQNSKFYDLYTTNLNWVDGSPATLYAAYDITEKRIYQQKIEQQAYTDFLTGLFNRMCCERDLALAIDQAKKYGKKGAILYIDLDDFKHINDGLGHQYGDVLLQTIAKNVRRISGIDDAFYRMGGDEFVIIISVEAYPRLEQIVDEVKTIFSKPWFLKDADYYCTMSMGIVEYPDAGDGIHDLIKKADVAMYEAKRGGKNRVVYYSDQLSDESNKRLDMEKNMRNASSGGFDEFEVYYQPIVDITKEGTPVVAAEALIRWNSHELGFITPDVFIPLAEYLGLINPIGNHVLVEACTLLKHLNDTGYPNFKISVNLSVVQLLQNDIVETIEKVVQETGVNPENLTLEVTESLAINDMRRMKRILSGIRELGIRIALDDFGTGYSSLNHVREIPLDIIKVDQSFVKELDRDSYSRAFIKMVAELAESIGVSVCVEGVERKEQYAEIATMRVKMIQGFYFGRPVPMAEFMNKLPEKEKAKAVTKMSEMNVAEVTEEIEESKEQKASRNFIQMEIDKDLAEGVYDTVHTRFPPEPNGYLHIGHAKSILLNYGLAKEYNGKFNMRFDDTNPTKEKSEFVESIKKDIEWLGADWEDRLFFASDYFDQMYEGAVKLIKKGKAYVSELTAEQMKEYRGTLTEPGKNDPSRERSVEENLKLFTEMKEGKYADGELTLRAKIDMTSPNMNMRDPIIYRVAHMSHQNTGDKWCIYPMYDFAHPIEDAIEGITHSICTLEFEDHRPLYNWVVEQLEYPHPPRQIEFAKMYLTNVVTGKRYIKRLVEEGIVDGWDDPRLVSIAGLRRRGFTPDSIRTFVELCGVSKSNASADYAMLEYCIREDLKTKRPRVMAALDPIKLVIDNYPEDREEMLEIPNNLENESLGNRVVPFGREVYIDRDDFMIEPPKKYFRMFPGNEVRLMNAYFVKCTSYETDENGNVTVVHGTYDPESKGGNSPDGRKVKGTIHWVPCKQAVEVTVRLYENLIDEEKGVYNEDGSLNLNPNSLTVLEKCYVEPAAAKAKAFESFQFVRQGFFTVDYKDSTKDHLVFNRIVSLKSSFVLPKNN